MNYWILSIVLLLGLNAWAQTPVAMRRSSQERFEMRQNRVDRRPKRERREERREQRQRRHQHKHDRRHGTI